jgi:hypothetical protein
MKAMRRSLLVAALAAMLSQAATAQAVAGAGPDSITVQWQSCPRSLAADGRIAPTYTSPVSRFRILDATQRAEMDSLRRLLRVSTYDELRGTAAAELVCNRNAAVNPTLVVLGIYAGSTYRRVPLSVSATSDVEMNVSEYLHGNAKPHIRQRR